MVNIILYTIDTIFSCADVLVLREWTNSRSAAAGSISLACFSAHGSRSSLFFKIIFIYYYIFFISILYRRITSLFQRIILNYNYLTSKFLILFNSNVDTRIFIYPQINFKLDHFKKIVEYFNIKNSGGTCKKYIQSVSYIHTRNRNTQRHLEKTQEFSTSMKPPNKKIKSNKIKRVKL
jgi:hypothetical protein